MYDSCSFPYLSLICIEWWERLALIKELHSRMQAMGTELFLQK
jgi:hypothetical protein